MFRVAICDDEKAICEDIENIILNFQKKSFVEVKMEIFYSGENLINFILQGNKFDLIFLDIKMNILLSSDQKHL